MLSVLVTGGTGFIGSHTIIELLNANYNVIIVDNLYNSDEKICKDEVRFPYLFDTRLFSKKRPESSPRLLFYKIDLLNYHALKGVFMKNPTIRIAIHFAAMKHIEESISIPLEYYNTNLVGTLNLLRILKELKIYNLLFSSSASIYGSPKKFPILEDFPSIPLSPYARSKRMIEVILKDIYNAEPEKWHIICLRYFNPCGAHSSSLIGENPQIVPQNLIQYISRTAQGLIDDLTIFGTDYPTPDGTAIRDYIHVVDLAIGHVKALNILLKESCYKVYNLGTGKGTSILEMIAIFEKVCGHPLKYGFGKNRPGDAPILVADTSLAENELDWKAQFSIEEMCSDHWKWKIKNPEGFCD